MLCQVKMQGLFVCNLHIIYLFYCLTMPTIHLLIKGKVQGVYYRATAKDIAQALELKGWVKNTREGHVELIVTGSEKALQQFIEWCRKGPDKAIVHSINVTSIKDEKFEDFRVIRG